MYLSCQCQGPWEGTTAVGSVDRSLLPSSPSEQAREMLQGEKMNAAVPLSVDKKQYCWLIASEVLTSSSLVLKI